jgi:hypothetical protein
VQLSADVAPIGWSPLGRGRLWSRSTGPVGAPVVAQYQV